MSIYYKAREQSGKPFILFDLIASDDISAIAGGYGTGTDGNVTITDPLVVTEENLPSYTGGICHKDILNGELVDRDPLEITQAIQENQEDNQIAQATVLRDILEQKRYTFGGNTFQLRYETLVRIIAFIQRGVNEDLTLVSTSGNATIATADLQSFYTGFYDAVLEATDPSQLDI